MERPSTILELLSDKSRWTQHVAARDAAGEQVCIESTLACKFCLTGALWFVYGDWSRTSDSHRKYSPSPREAEAKAKIKAEIEKIKDEGGATKYFTMAQLNDNGGYDAVMQVVRAAGV